MSIVASWKPNAPITYHADAQKVADEIYAIGESPIAEQIVDRARDSGTELHKCFEWDDSIAGEKYRLHQARQMMTCLIIKNVNPEKKDAPPVRLFYVTDKGKGYKPADVVFKNVDNYQKILAQAMSELRAFKKKYHNLQEIQEILDLIPD